MSSLGPAASDSANDTRPLVLIVDDFDDAREIYETYLTFRGYRVLTASSGQECLDIASRECPSVVFLDVRMPELTGVDTIHLLRVNPAMALVPIVALTAYALEGERLELLAAGFDEVIAKPCLPDDLETALIRLLQLPPSVAASH